MTEQQQHLNNLLQQRQSLQKEIDQLKSVTETRKELYFKVQGAIEYLNQIGITLSETVDKEKEVVLE